MKNKTCGECRKHDIDCIIAKQAPACDFFEPKVITNGDRIRSMSDVELADILSPRCEVCIYSNPNDCDFRKCEKGMLAWLKQEAKDE
jgi:hypothetical protein